MAKSNGGYGYPRVWNETGTGGPESPDVTGLGLYFDGWSEIDKMHLAQTGPMESTPNSRSGGDMLGGPAPGEPNPAGMGKSSGGD